jgi:hypothetical protein
MNDREPRPDDGDENDGLIPVNSVDEIPANMTEAEEADFWDTHCLGPGLLAQTRPAGKHGVFSARGLKPSASTPKRR